MKCPKCGLSLPNDSEFCQYCGAIILHKQTEELNNIVSPSTDAPSVVTIQQAENPLMHGADDSNALLPSKKDGETSAPRYCKKCGGEIDRRTKKCQNCGKQYFCARTMLPILISIFFIILLAGLNVYQYINGQVAEDTITQLEQDIVKKDSTISSQDDELTSLRRENINLLVKLAFYERFAVVVPDDGTKLYHTYGCSYLNESSFWIYNIEAAEDKGFKPCPYCQK